MSLLLNLQERHIFVAAGRSGMMVPGAAAAACGAVPARGRCGGLLLTV